jgi:hypothetical protein
MAAPMGTAAGEFRAPEMLLLRCRDGSQHGFFSGDGSEISAISVAMHYLKTPCFQGAACNFS